MKLNVWFIASGMMLALLSRASGQGSAINYQGRINEGSAAPTGTYDLRFAVYDQPSGGNLAGPIVTNAGAAVVDGVFTVTLDFGDGAFAGGERWLEIAVRTNSADLFTTLAPRQLITAVPFALFSRHTSNLLGTLPAQQLSGALSLAQLPTEVLTNSQEGVNLTGLFSGNGRGLTNLPVDSLVRVTTNSSLVGWGANNFGQATPPPGLNRVKALAAGLVHNLALNDDGTVSAWGANGPATNVPPGLNGVVAVAAGLNHSLALKMNGTVVAWGENDFGQTNIPANWTNIVGIAAAGEFNVAVRSDGTVVAKGRNQAGQTNVPPGLNGVVAVGGGFIHGVALRTNGTIVAWGGNNVGQTDVPPGLSNVVAIASGWTHTLALKADGKVVAWGLDEGGKTNVPAGLSNVVAISAGMEHSTALRADGRVFAWGANNNGQTNVPAGLNGVVSIAQGPAANHSVASRNQLYSPVPWLDANNTFEGINTFKTNVQINGSVVATAFSGNGAGLSNVSVHAANIIAGTLSDARLSANVAFLNSSPAFSGQVSAGAGMRLNDEDLWLRSSGSVNGLGWYGTNKLFGGVSVNGPVLYGASGGALGQSSGRGDTIALRWNGFDDVGIGRNSAANRLEVEGAASKTTSGNWLANSDARIKTSVRAVDGALETLARVRLVRFRYTDEYRAQHSSIEDRDYLNVVAQEFQQVFPDYVQGSGEKLADGSEILQVDIHPLTIYSAAAVQELNRKLEREMAAKDAEIAELKRIVHELKELISNADKQP